MSNSYSTTASKVIKGAFFALCYVEIPHIKNVRRFMYYKITVSINIGCLAKLILVCLVNFIGRSFGLFVKIQWRHETEQSCVENQVKPSLEDQEDVK